jgi:hypothetical protein
MSYEIDLNNSTAIIPHPNRPELKIHVNRLTDFDKFAHFAALEKYSTPMVVTDSDHKIVYVKEGNKDVPLIHVVQNIPIESFVDLFTRTIFKWEGFTSKGTPVVYNPKLVKNLFNTNLQATIPNPRLGGTKDDGEPEPETITIPFWSYLADKILDDTTFESDPTVAT